MRKNPDTLQNKNVTKRIIVIALLAAGAITSGCGILESPKVKLKPSQDMFYCDSPPVLKATMEGEKEYDKYLDPGYLLERADERQIAGKLPKHLTLGTIACFKADKVYLTGEGLTLHAEVKALDRHNS